MNKKMTIWSTNSMTAPAVIMMISDYGYTTLAMADLCLFGCKNRSIWRNHIISIHRQNLLHE